MSIDLRFIGFLDALSSAPAGPSAAHLVSKPICAASLPTLVRNAGQRRAQELLGILAQPPGGQMKGTANKRRFPNPPTLPEQDAQLPAEPPFLSGQNLPR